MVKEFSTVKTNNKKILKHISKVGIGIICFALMTSPGWAIADIAPVEKPRKIFKIHKRLKKVGESSVRFFKNLFFSEQVGGVGRICYFLIGAVLWEIWYWWINSFDEDS